MLAPTDSIFQAACPSTLSRPWDKQDTQVLSRFLETRLEDGAVTQVNSWLTDAVDNRILLRASNHRLHQQTTTWFNDNLLALTKLCKKLEQTWRKNYDPLAKWHTERQQTIITKP